MIGRIWKWLKRLFGRRPKEVPPLVQTVGPSLQRKRFLYRMERVRRIIERELT